MLRLIIVSLLVAFTAGEITPYIVGGNNAAPGQIPYQASLRTSSDFHFCGGSIITDRWVLSAAHCTFGKMADSITVVVGTIYLNNANNPGDRYQSSVIINHELYNPRLKVNDDISIVKTNETIIYTPNVQKISMGKDFILAGTAATASGWGRTSYSGSAPNNLQVVELSTISNVKCILTFGKIILPSNLCTDTQDARGICLGDSGGPLFFNGKLIGIASFVGGNGCAAGFPDGWTRVENYEQWVSNKIALNK